MGLTGDNLAKLSRHLITEVINTNNPGPVGRLRAYAFSNFFLQLTQSFLEGFQLQIHDFWFAFTH
jgi:hypothetical protein